MIDHCKEIHNNNNLDISDTGHEEHVRVGGADDQGKAGPGRDRDLCVEV